MEVILNAENLLNWFDMNKREYPWGKVKSPYRVWISEIMLQQTVAASVIPYFEKWCNDYPDVKSLASAELNEVLSHWEGLGYYSRCRNLHKAANVLMESFSGNLPDTYKEMTSLQGIGDYTARAVLSIAFNKSYAVLDANVRRIVQRLTATMNWEKGLDKQAVAELERSIPSERPGDFNEAMMQLGQQICTSASPKCNFCPLVKNCHGFKQGIAEKIPVKLKKKIKTADKAALIICMNRQILLRKKKRGLFHDLWLLPVVQTEKTKVILWMGINWSKMDPVKLIKRNHFYTDHKDILSPYLYSIYGRGGSQPAPTDNDDYEYRWIDIDKLEKYPSPSVYRKILNDAKDIL